MADTANRTGRSCVRIAAWNSVASMPAAMLVRQRFQRALHTALEAETADLKDARPRVNLDAMVRRLMLDAAGGDRGAMKLILSELDHEIALEEPVPAGGSMAEEAEEESGEQGAAAPPPVPDYALWRKANREE